MFDDLVDYFLTQKYRLLSMKTLNQKNIFGDCMAFWIYMIASKAKSSLIKE